MKYPNTEKDSFCTTWYNQYKYSSANYWASMAAAIAMILDGSTLAEASEKHNIPPSEIKAELNNRNKAFNDHIVSWKTVHAVKQLEGASVTSIGPDQDTGVMQILPATWDEMNTKYFNGRFPYQKYKPYKNNPISLKEMERVQVAIGLQYLKHISSYLDSHKSQWKANKGFLILACYNGGMSRIKNCNFDADIIKSKYPGVYRYAERGCNIMDKKIK